MSYDVYWVKNRAEKITDFEHPTLQGALGCYVRLPRAMPWAVEAIELSARTKHKCGYNGECRIVSVQW